MPSIKRWVYTYMHIVEPSHYYTVAQDKGILDGRMYSNCTVGYILSLGVCSSFRRQGVASLLLDSFLTHVTQSENQICKAIYLHVLTMNSAAIRFYEKHYFRYMVILYYNITFVLIYVFNFS